MSMVELVRADAAKLHGGMTMRAGHVPEVVRAAMADVVVIKCSAVACPVRPREVRLAEMVAISRAEIEQRVAVELEAWRDDHLTAWAAELRS